MPGSVMFDQTRVLFAARRTAHPSACKRGERTIATLICTTYGGLSNCFPASFDRGASLALYLVARQGNAALLCRLQ